MMTCSSLATALSVAALSTPLAAAQTQVTAPQRLRAVGPPTLHTLDLDTGRLRAFPGVRQGGPQAASAVCFDNSIDDDGVYDALLFPAGDELFDWGVKSCGGSTFVDRLSILYASLAPTVASGGPGGQLTLRIYAGATGFGDPGTLVATLPLTGLPSEPGVFTGITLHRLTIDLGASSFFLPDGPIGWSYTNPDGQTAPGLVDVDPSLGTQNALDLYHPAPASPASYVTTFTLGPGGGSNDPKENSLYLQLFENDVQASVTVLPAGANPEVLAATPPLVGGTWIATLDLATEGREVVETLVAVATALGPGASTPAGTLLLDPTALLVHPSRSTELTHRFRIPLDSVFVGAQLFAQGAFVTRDGFQLTNGLDLTVGTF